MAVDPVPFVIGGGAAHSDEVFRTMLSAATQEAQGIALPGHLAVTATATPSRQVSVAAGAVLVRNFQAPGQSYMGRVATPTLVDIPANSTGSPRYDLLMARIIDPDYAPWQPYTDPAQIAGGPYFELYVKPGVSASTTRADQVVGYSAVELALITVPANNGNITQGNIAPLRTLARARTHSDLASRSLDGIGGILWETSYVPWPLWQPTFYCPPWATWVNAIIHLTGVQVSGGVTTDGDLRGVIRTASNAAAFQTSGSHGFDFNPSNTGGDTRENFTITVGGVVPTSARGTNVEVLIEGRRYEASTGVLDGGIVNSAMAVQVYFSERVT